MTWRFQERAALLLSRTSSRLWPGTILHDQVAVAVGLEDGVVARQVGMLEACQHGELGLVALESGRGRRSP